jgi:cytosine/adenosine deaminase-related metal-dependent hydrolase
MSGDLLIRGAMVLDPESPLRVADIRIEAGTITSVGDSGSADCEVIDAEGMIAMPGLINAHTHSGQHLDRGVAPNLPLDLWLLWTVYGGPPLDPDDSYTLAAVGGLEMLETGCTAVLDHPWIPLDGFDDHVEAVASAYADLGIRAGLAPMIQDRDIFESMSFGDDAAPPPLAEAVDPAALTAAMERFLVAWQDAPRLVPLVGPSAPQRCSDELMHLLADLALTHGVGFHTHVLETRTQVVATRARYGRSVVEVLHELGLLTPSTSLAHCVWMDADEYAIVRDAGATIVHNPVSNLRCGSGLLPLAGLLAEGVSIALGADGAASNDNQNMFEAMKIAALVHSLTSDYRAWPTATDIWRLCLHGGASALGRAIGRIEAGAAADIVLLDGARHCADDHDSLVRSLVFAEHGSSVDTVIVDGDPVVRDGRHWADVADIHRRARSLQHRIHASLPRRIALLEEYGSALGQAHDHAHAGELPIDRHASITPAFRPVEAAARG